MTVVAVALVVVAVVCLAAVITVPTVRHWRFGGDYPESQRETDLLRYLWYGALMATIGATTIWPGVNSGSDRLVGTLAASGGMVVVMSVARLITTMVLRLFVTRGHRSARQLGVPGKSRVSPLGSGLRPVQ